MLPLILEKLIGIIYNFVGQLKQPNNQRNYSIEFQNAIKTLIDKHVEVVEITSLLYESHQSKKKNA